MLSIHDGIKPHIKIISSQNELPVESEAQSKCPLQDGEVHSHLPRLIFFAGQLSFRYFLLDFCIALIDIITRAGLTIIAIGGGFPPASIEFGINVP